MKSNMPASSIGAVTAQPWQEGADAPVLPQAYQDLLDVAAGAGRTWRTRTAGAAPGRPAAAPASGQVEARGPGADRLGARHLLPRRNV
jgi:hypothetical protein